MKNKQAYRYQKIDSCSHIRLVKITAKEGRKQVELKLDVVPIREVKGRYEAVSYMWGPQSDERHVRVEGKKLNVRYNIWRCLKHLRDHDLAKSWLWIDSICINQRDDEEKSLQVAKMAEIFRTASSVLIWLGSTSLQTYLLRPGEERLQHSIEHLPPKDWDSWIDVLGYWNSDCKNRSLEDQMMSIVHNPYWQRVWIVQEVALAQNARIVFGKAFLNSDCFPAIYTAVRESSKPGYSAWIARQRDPSIENVGTGILDNHPMSRVNQEAKLGSRKESLGELVHAVHLRCCSNPRDYIFGLSGLLDPRRPLQVDYKFSKEEVAVRAMHYLEEEGDHQSRSLEGLRLDVANMLLNALSVTSHTLSEFEASLPASKVQALPLDSFKICLWPMITLVADDNDTAPRGEVQQEVFRLHISGNLMKNYHVEGRRDYLELKLLNGNMKRFAYIRERGQPGEKSDLMMQCMLGFSACMLILRWPSNGGDTVFIEHLIQPDITRGFSEAPLDLEVHLPISLRNTLEEKINSCRDWSNFESNLEVNSFIQLSALEIVSICELIEAERGCTIDSLPRTK